MDRSVPGSAVTIVILALVCVIGWFAYQATLPNIRGGGDKNVGRAMFRAHNPGKPLPPQLRE